MLYLCTCVELDGQTFYGVDCEIDACTSQYMLDRLGAGVDTCLSQGVPYIIPPIVTCLDGWSTLPGGLLCDNELCRDDTCTNGECVIDGDEAFCDCSVADEDGQTFYGDQCQYSHCNTGVNYGATDGDLCIYGISRLQVEKAVQLKVHLD